MRVSKKKDGGNVTTASVSGGIGGNLTLYGLPLEVHGGPGYTRVLSSGSLRQAVTSAANYASSQLAAIAKKIDDLRSAIYQYFGANPVGSNTANFSNNSQSAPSSPSTSSSKSNKK